ncbi:hypothetical protein AB4525_08285 [Vibrio breoganii]
MIKNQLALLPTEPAQKAVALAFAEVIKKEGRARGETPYANAFCRAYFGKSRPAKSYLLVVVDSSSDTVPVIMRKLDRFLESNGEKRYLVNWYFANCAFPSKSTNTESRFTNHTEMLVTRNNKIADKEAKLRQAYLESKKSRILNVSQKDLPAWVSDEEENLTELELNQCLRHWFNEHDKSDYKFYDLYYGYTASRIALDLSFA